MSMENKYQRFLKAIAELEVKDKNQVLKEAVEEITNLADSKEQDGEGHRNRKKIFLNRED